jgi:hypothetical protein
MLFLLQLGIKSHTKIFSCVGIWNFCAIDEDWLLFNLLVCEVNMYRFGFVEFYSPLFVRTANLFTVKNRVFWDVTPCGSCKNRRFGGIYRLLHQGDKNR